MINAFWGLFIVSCCLIVIAVVRGLFETAARATMDGLANCVAIIDFRHWEWTSYAAFFSLAICVLVLLRARSQA